MPRHDPHFKAAPAGDGQNRDRADSLAETKHTREGIVRNAFDPRDRMRLKEMNDALPVIGRLVRQIDLEAVFTASPWTITYSGGQQSHSESLLRPADLAWEQAGFSGPRLRNFLIDTINIACALRRPVPVEELPPRKRSFASGTVVDA